MHRSAFVPRLQGESACSPPAPGGSTYCSTQGLCLPPPSASNPRPVNASADPPTITLLGPAVVTVGRGQGYAACPPNPLPSLVCDRCAVLCCVVHAVMCCAVLRCGLFCLSAAMLRKKEEIWHFLSGDIAEC